MFRTPGPTIPTQVLAISGAMPPWFQANVWLLGPGRNVQEGCNAAPHWAELVNQK
jgi:hypothetical protein